MTGTPKKRALIGEMARRIIAELPDKPDATPLDYVCWRIANGETLRAVARSFGVSPQMVIELVDNAVGADARRDGFARAREIGAHQLAEEAIEISDAASPSDANVATLQVRTRQWVAERWNRREFGTQPGTQVNVSIGALMLEALKAPSAIASAIAEPAEVLSIEDASTSALEHRTTNATPEPAKLGDGSAKSLPDNDLAGTGG